MSSETRNDARVSALDDDTIRKEGPVEQPAAKWEGLFPKKHPLVVVNTGNGKGKTTAALGVTMRAWGRGWNICWLQFIKKKDSHYGETFAAERMGIEMYALGDGFTWLSENIENDIALAKEAWDLAREKIMSEQFDLIVLDEITYPITYKWLDVDVVLETLRSRPKDVDIIITGRDAHPRLVEFADTVTEMTEVKHAYQAGVKAQPGIDY
ncbi:MAG: cob(I)yrinic acid a,c-diamide adenosyltransferase [Dehalococcoidia bacterium]